MFDSILVFLIVTYLLIINLIGFTMMGIDKKRAKRREWRIPEKTLFIVALIGGSIGSVLGMQLFRHKTKHKSFRIGMPAILILHLTGILFFLIHLNYQSGIDFLTRL